MGSAERDSATIRETGVLSRELKADGSTGATSRSPAPGRFAGEEGLPAFEDVPTRDRHPVSVPRITRSRIPEVIRPLKASPGPLIFISDLTTQSQSG
jgi:hypothetical protein